MLRFGVVWCACALRWWCVCVSVACGVVCVWLLACGVVWCVCVCVNVWSVARLGARKTPPTRAHVQHASVCSFKTPPCVAARRPHVFNMRASCCFTRRRFETTHGGVLDMSTEGRGGSLSLPFCPCFFLYFVLFLLLLFSSLFSSFLLFSSPLFSPTNTVQNTDQPTRRPTSRCDLARASQH